MARRKAKLVVKTIHAVVSCAVAEYKEQSYCFCPTCRKGYVLVSPGAFFDEVDCERSRHYLNEPAIESVIDNPTR